MAKALMEVLVKWHFSVELETGFGWTGQYFMETLKMLGRSGRKNNNVIKITNTGLQFQATKDSIKPSLKSGWSAAQSELQHVKLIQAVWCGERSFLVYRLHS